jgi:uncharacterized membrane protein required for colicin V production
MDWDADSLENLYYAIGAIVVAYLVFNGWRQGVVRQFMALLAVASAYAVGYFGSAPVAPLFAFLRYADPIPRLIGGAVAGTVTYLVVSTVSRRYFKKTHEKAQGRVRLSYGIFGGVLGLVFGLALFFAASELVRMLSRVAQTTNDVAAHTAHPLDEPQAVNPVVSGIAKLGTALDSGGSGEFFKKVDPVPPHVFATLAKLGQMVSHPDALDRFLTYPGIDRLTNHPKLHDLRADPEVAKLIATQSYFRLLRHQKVVALASDPEFAAEVRAMDFDKAFDYALKPAAPATQAVPPVPWPEPEIPALPIEQLRGGRAD